MISSAMFHRIRSVNTCISFYPLWFCKNIHHSGGALSSNKAKRSKYKSQSCTPPQNRAPRSFCGKKSQGNFKTLTAVVCHILHSLNPDSFRPPETHVSEAHTLLHWQSCVVGCREYNDRNPTDHNSHDRAWSWGGREKQFSQLTLSQAFQGLIRS